MVLRVALVVIAAVLLGIGCGLAVVGAASTDGDATADSSATTDTNTNSVDVLDADGADHDGGANDASETTDAKIDATPPPPCATACYFIIDDGTQPQTKARCVELGAHLVVFNTAPEMTPFVSPTTDLWIGLESPTPSNVRSDFRWVNGETSDFEDAGWHLIEPNANTGCVVLNMTNWSDRGCSEVHGAICEYP